MQRKETGQSLVLIVMLVSVAVVAVIAFLNLSTLHAVRAHARQALQTATAAGAKEVDYGALGGDRILLDAERAGRTSRAVFESALSLSTYGLAADPATIAQSARIEAHNDTPWLSPYTGLRHDHPTVAAVAEVPVRIFFVPVSIRVRAEAEVSSR